MNIKTANRPAPHRAWLALLPGFLMLGLLAPPAESSAADWTTPWNVVWSTPSRDAAGSMPLGNGEVGISLWVEAGGDLRFYISRSDSLSEVSRLLKVGGVRVALSPNPFADGVPFRQELRLRDGVCEITAGEGAGRVHLRVFVDAELPVVHCVGESASPISVRAIADGWRTQPHTLAQGEELNSSWTLHGAPFPLVESGDATLPGALNAAVWYHRNEESVAFPQTLKVQSLEAAAAQARDPLLHRTFGGWLTGEGFKKTGEGAVATFAPVKSFALRVAAPCEQTPTAQAWIDNAGRIARKSADPAAALRRTAAWWEAFWDRSRVIANTDSTLAIPGEAHSLRVARDAQGQNQFPGELGRTSVYGLPLGAAEIARLAASGHAEPSPISEGRLMTGGGEPRVIPSDRLSFLRGLTLEAWIQPDAATPGRIFDKITPGGTDGFLFDTHPGNALRLIVGSTILTASSGVLKTGQWQHAAAVVDAASGKLRIYLDGKLVAEAGGDDGSSLTRGYTLQRYAQACGGRGTYPIKFNGGIFTVEPKVVGKPFNADFRAWGDCHWWQNLRHMYHPMLASGDLEMMEPLFRLYENARPLCEARARLYHGARGCYFPETMTVWGTYANGDYGWNRAGHQPNEVLCPYWQYAWNQGPEIVALMLDRWDYARNDAFLRSRVLPMAESVLQYFDTRFKKTPEGKIVLDPTQAVETLWTGVVNDMPTTAGLNDICGRLCQLPQALTTPEQRAFFARLKAACPVPPIAETDDHGRKVRVLAPAEKYDPVRSNCENPELYAIWPFRLFGVGRPGLAEARLAYERRANHLDVGWGYDGNCAALLGLADEAGRILKVKCANSHPAYRWPATWGPNFDWVPDQNHGGNLLETTQLMLLQSVGNELRLLPAWPRKWDVEFKLHAPRSTVVECVYRGGKVARLVVTPASRRKDVVLPEGL